MRLSVLRRPRYIAALAGALIATGQAPLGWWFVALPALVWLTAFVAAEAHAKQAAMLGWIGGAAYFAAAMFWIVEPFLIDLPRYGWMAPFALIFMALGMGLFWMLAAGFAVRIAPTPGTRAIAFAFALASVEALRSYLLTGFPWALIGHIWINTPVAQAAALVGPIGLTALSTLAASLAVVWRSRRGVTMGGLMACALIGVVWAGGSVRLAEREATADKPLHLRLVQPNTAQYLKWREDTAQALLDTLLSLLETPAAEPRDLVILPETAVPWLLNRPGLVLEDLANAAGGAAIALGIQREEGLRFYNSLAVLDNRGTPVALYDKFHLVPFGEYIPFGDFAANFGIKAFAAREGNYYSAGPGAQVLDLGRFGKVQPLICYEAVFPQDLHAAPERPDWLLQVTNDGWFGKISGPYQHFEQARLRTIEQGLPMVRVANTGVTAVIDAKGRVLASLALGTQGVLDVDLPAALPATLYAKTGDGPVIAALLLVLAALTFLWRRRVA